MPEYFPNGLGTPHYLVIDPDVDPYTGTIDLVLEEVRSLEQATIYLVNPDHTVELVHVQSTDGDPDYLNWEVTLQDGGEVVETIKYDPADPQNVEKAERLSNVRGFM